MSMLPEDLDPELATAFFDEAAEGIEQLGVQLQAMEREPDDAMPIREAFRHAHSLKGLCAAVGLQSTTIVLHALEDVLGRVRDGEVRPDSDLVSALLDACDLVSAMLDSVISGGDEDPARDADVDRIRDQLEVIAEGGDYGGTRVIEPLAPPSRDVRDALQQDGLRLLRIAIHVDAASGMPAVRAFQALLQVQQVGDVLTASPTIEQLEAGELPTGTLQAWVATELDDQHMCTELLACEEVAAADVVAWSDTHEADSSTLADPAISASPDSQPGSAAPEDITPALLQGSRTVRVESSRLDALMHSVGELLVHRSHVETLASQRLDPELRNAVDELSRAAQEMQAMVMDVRMVSIDAVFRRMPRVVRDLARGLGKDVQLLVSGSATELDRTVVDLLGDPLTHLIRNSIDHGIEAPADRIAAGKPAQGTLAISAVASGGVVVVRVQDDGRGIRPDVIRALAVERGILTAEEAAAMDDDAALQLCFRAGFSTREQITETSGRGVGLDVVRSKLRSLGGDVIIASSPDGTLMTMKLPLTLAIVSVLLVRVAGHTYAVPATRVRSTADEVEDVLRSIGSAREILHDDEVVPLVSLADLLQVEAGAASQVVFVEGLGSSVALLVDEVCSLAEVVTRPVPSVVASSRFLSASAMLGDGEITFLVDTEAIVQSAEKGRVHA